MVRNEFESTQLGPDPELELAEYRAVNPMAVVGLLLGLGAPLAMVNPLLWIVPMLGVVICGVALRAIGAEGGRWIGRKAAVVGLVLSIVFGLAGPTELLTSNWWVGREARMFGALWFDLLRDGEAHKAHQFDAPWNNRHRLDAGLWNMYRNTPDAHLSLERFVEEPLVRTLLALGARAEVRLWESDWQNVPGGKAYVSQYYAVTYDDPTKPEGKRRTSFFAQLVLELSEHPYTDEGYWRIFRRQGGGLPPSLEGRGS